MFDIDETSLAQRVQRISRAFHLRVGSQLPSILFTIRFRHYQAFSILMAPLVKVLFSLFNGRAQDCVCPYH